MIAKSIRLLSSSLASVVVVSILVSSCMKLSSIDRRSSDPATLTNESNPIRIAARLDGNANSDTKGATTVNTTSLRTSGFGMTAYWREYGYVFDGTSDSHNFFKNVRPEYQGVIEGKETWSFSPTVFWPVKASLSFFAYAPYMADGNPYHEIQPNEGDSTPGGHFTQAVNPSSMIDFCLAPAKYDLNSTSGAVNLTFKHALTKVQFYLNIKGVVYPDEDYVYRVKSIVISGVVGENDYIYQNDSFRWAETPRQDLSSRTASYTLSRENGQLVSTLLPHEKDLGGVEGVNRYIHVNSPESGVLYMLPQPIASSSKVTITLTACTQSGGTVTEEEDLDPIDVWLPEKSVWEPGTIIAYLISLDTTTWVETLFTTHVTEWGSASEDANIFDNAVYVTKIGAACSVTSVGNGFTAGDLKINPPTLYINDSPVSVSEWVHFGNTLTATTVDGDYIFTLAEGIPNTVEFI